MAEIDSNYKYLTYEEMAKDLAERTLDEVLYDGRSIREWMQIIASDDCISRQAVQTELKNCEVVNVRDENDNIVGYYNADTVDSIVRNLPPVTPQPKMGHWIKISPAGIYECSECGQNVMTSDICAYKFCHGCSAKMIEPQESEG